MLYLILGGLFYLYLGACVWAALFNERDDITAVLLTGFASLLWPITLVGIGMYKFTCFINKL
jgi:ActR/RegA family two-component response regulator